MSGQMWFTADLHLGHKLVSQLRGFGDDTIAHDAELAKRWDFLVNPGDQIWVLGDLCTGRGKSHTAALEWISQRTGTKHLIFGNHDSGHPMHSDSHKVQAQYLAVFASAQQSGIRKISGERVMLSHFPFGTSSNPDHTVIRYPEWRLPDVGQWLIHGHTHSGVKQRGRELHVGLDAHSLAPVPLKWVAQRIAQEKVSATAVST